MKVAILGATSQIAKDLIELLFNKTDYKCVLFSRKQAVVTEWLDSIDCNYKSHDYSLFSSIDKYDVLINFVGVGDPAAAIKMGSDIFDVTYKYDMMAIDYLKSHINTKYIFLSSGAVYGSSFDKPVTEDSVAKVSINTLDETHWYMISKLYAEARHRALGNEYSIIDVRVFNYISPKQDFTSKFFISDLIRALINKDVFLTSKDNIVRDYITPSDFFNMIQAIINSASINLAIDCRTKAPIDKFSLLKVLEDKFGLKYSVLDKGTSINATGKKLNYYSLSKSSEKVGYKPSKTSVEGIVNVIQKVLS